MIHALTPVLYVTKTGVPKPPFLDPSIIQQLRDKVCIVLFFMRYYQISIGYFLARNIEFITTFWLLYK
jgi:hypothetical protein